MSDNNSGSDFVLGAMVGAAIGVAVSLLFTTEKGADIRENVRIGANDLLEKGKVGFEQIEQNTVKKGKEIVRNVSSKTGQFASKIEKEADRIEAEASK